MTPSVNSPLSADDVEVVDKQTPYQGYFKVDTYRLKHRLFEGGWSGEMEREVFERGHAVAVLPYDPVLDRVVLIEQFRPGAFAALKSQWFDDGASPWLIECVAGIIEKGEKPEDVVRRESIEETGCEIREILPIHHYLVSPGGTSESVFVYCGRTDASNAEGVYGLTDEHENIRVFSLAAKEAFALLDEGRIINAMTIIALQWLKANHAQVRENWRGQ
ncbi:MAG: NUDIX domain-containing protein [Rhodospirillales bacterium]|nr:NUDIX domain-containing protein [Rhodospirillales bacterium]